MAVQMDSDEGDVEPDSRRVLVIQRSSNLDGSAFSALLTADGLKEAGWKVHVAFGFEGPIIDRFQAAGHTTHVVLHDNWLRREHSLRFIRDVVEEWRQAKPFRKLIDRIHPDLVYINTVVSLAGAVAARQRHVPCVWHIRELFATVGGEMHAPAWALPIVRLIIRHHATKLVANSKATAQNILGKAHLDDVDIVPNAVGNAFFDSDIKRVEARQEFNLPQEATVIGVPGTLRPMKGHPFFFRAMAPLLQGECHDVMVAVTGSGNEEYVERLHRLVHQLDIEEQIRFLGWVTNMPAFYQVCDVVCVPSRAEPFGRTVIEAFASGTPVVATAVGGMQEIIDGESTGVLVSYGNDSELQAAILRVSNKTKLRQKMRENARVIANERYREGVYKQRIAHLVSDIAGRTVCKK